MRNFIIGALSVGAVYLLYMAYKKSQESKVVTAKKENKESEAPKEPPFACPEGEVLCAQKEKTCYNPVAKYIVDPCM